MGASYERAGVSLGKAEDVVERLRATIESTWTPGVMGPFGRFAGLYRLDDERLLAASTDGLGTKLVLARRAGRLRDAGACLAAHCINDVLTTGAAPLFFLDYAAAAQLDLGEIADLVEGAAVSCRAAGCAILGGETAEMPDVYREGELDFAGTCVGLVSSERLVDGSRIQPGDVVLGLPSSGLHCNGYTLVRRLLGDDPFDPDLLLAPTRLYVDEVKRLRELCDVRGLANVTGGGIPGNLRRILPSGLRRCDRSPCMEQAGGLPLARRKRGSRGGATACLQPRDRVLRRRSRRGGAEYGPPGHRPAGAGPRRRGLRRRVIGVLVSGAGTNLQALIDAELPISAVASNLAGVAALDRAARAGIPTAAFELQAYSARAERDSAMADWLVEHGVSFVVCAGYMQLLTPGFLRRFSGGVINVHPSLLPAFPGASAVADALAAGVTETGVTVHFVDNGIDSGPIIVQEPVPILPGDTERSLLERLHEVEHRLLPRATRDILATRLNSPL